MEILPEYAPPRASYDYPTTSKYTRKLLCKVVNLLNAEADTCKRYWFFCICFTLSNSTQIIIVNSAVFLSHRRLGLNNLMKLNYMYSKPLTIVVSPSNHINFTNLKTPLPLDMCEVLKIKYYINSNGCSLFLRHYSCNFLQLWWFFGSSFSQSKKTHAVEYSLKSILLLKAKSIINIMNKLFAVIMFSYIRCLCWMLLTANLINRRLKGDT